MSRSRARLAGALALMAVVSGGLAGCDAGSAVPGASPSEDASSASASPTPQVSVAANVKRGEQDVPVDRAISVSAQDGTIASVEVSSPAGPVAGELAPDQTSWTATGRLEPGTRYVVKTVATDAAGAEVRRTVRFRTQDLTLDQQTFASVAPLQGETVGVGMPVIVTFDLPVTDKAAFEQHMTVTSTPAQPGTWHWLSDTEAHWRPKSYWQAGTKVDVDVDVNSVAAGGGIYGQESRQVAFEIGDAHVYRVNAQTHQMKVFRNGKLLRTLPITTGKPGFTTRSGVKVIMEKFESRRMNSETVGISRDNPEAYDIDDVRWAMRLTNSGEFIHAAPWSVGSQGYANVSHGCTGMSTDNAAWLYAMTLRGDVVEYTGTDRPMTLDNGYGDWNESFKQYRQGSALA
ncbi:L,D-transpeptidase family protein [Nocardioides sp. MAH-18]|uniref:L,D-transpeptidase family protein n=1 Tax=Nocardioides agri TaxID=2682843 RepID=A0A6L6XYD5_9ACTN|nr:MULTISPECIES: Ig-like domain-containing protein [unclassified Nocardioides]MBA2952244.1 L,D-transpeptidase [Nocardioides sp. CGMCC 1.13656]MVQ51406.1 L,D-transpeptidase family protein [Nocardioides sp. MAH-18]